jgi:hypothetical protein
MPCLMKLKMVNAMNKKAKKPDWKDIVIVFETAILAFILFHNWDGVKAFLSTIFS